LLGEQFINNLSEEQDCKPFTKGKDKVKDCKCCSKFACNLQIVKDIFHGLHKEFWALSQPTNIPAQELSVVEGEIIANFLQKYCTFLSARKPFYEFPVPDGNAVISICLPTAMRIFGGTKTSFQIVQQQHTKDKKGLAWPCLSLPPRIQVHWINPMNFTTDFVGGSLNLWLLFLKIILKL